MDLLQLIFAFVNAPVFATFLLGMFWKRTTGHGAFFGLVCRKDGRLAVAVASAEAPQGHYRDHGPLVAQPLGSIDAFVTTDERGRPHLLWKEDGNSQNKPTVIWSQRLSRDGKRLTGKKRELLRNDPRTWEEHLIEASRVCSSR